MSRRKKSPDRRKPERQSGIQSPKDRCEALDAIVRAFTHPQGMERHMTQSLWRGEVFNPAHTRVTVADGRVVSAVTMAPRMMRFGPVGIPAMTIGPVGTHDHYRKRGYSAAAMNDASDYMAREGCMLAYLQGIPDYYYRFGYYPFMAPSHVKFNRDAARKQSLPGRLRAMTARDIPVIRKIYGKVTAGRIGPAKRDKAVWGWLLGPGTKTWLFVGPKVILDGDGKECGYLTMDAKGALRIREIVVDPSEKSIRAALGAVTREARRRESREVTLPLPWDDSLAVFVRQCVGAEFTMHSNATGGPVLKIVNLPALMQALESADPQERIWAAQTTGDLGQAALAASITLRALSRTDPHAEVRDAAKQALRRIGSNGTVHGGDIPAAPR